MKSCQMYVIKIAYTCFILAQSFFRAYIFILTPLTFTLLALSLLFNPDMSTQILPSLSLYSMSNISIFTVGEQIFAPWEGLTQGLMCWNLNDLNMSTLGCHTGAVVRFITQECPGLDSQTDPFPVLLLGSLWVHAQCKDVQVKLIAYFKLSTAVIVGVCGYLSLHDSPVIKWQLVQGVSRLHSVGAGIGYSPTLLMLSRVRWMNGQCHKIMKLFIKSLLRPFKLLVLSSQHPESKTCRIYYFWKTCR